MLGGVIGGLAEHFGVDATVLRVIWALVVIFSMFVPGILAYLIMLLIIPEESSSSVPPAGTASAVPPTSSGTEPQSSEAVDEERKTV